MATSIVPFRKLQIGMESTKGTLVAATRVLVGNHRFNENIAFYRSAYPRGVRATVGGAGVITRRGVSLEIDTELTAEEILWFLLTGIRGAVSGSDSSGDVTWTFTPELTSVPTLDAATLEFIQGDGSTNHMASECGYAMTESFKIDWSADAANDPVKLSAKMFARARQTTTPTGSLTPYTTREPLVPALSKHYLDTSWAGLGGTQMTGLCRSGSIEVMTGLSPDYTGDGRSDKDFTEHNIGSLGARQTMVWEFDANGASRFANYRANDIVYIRNQFNGSTVVAAARKFQIDGAWRFVDTPSFSESGEQILMSANLEACYDDTGTKILEFVALNGLTAVA